MGRGGAKRRELLSPAAAAAAPSCVSSYFVTRRNDEKQRGIIRRLVFSGDRGHGTDWENLSSHDTDFFKFEHK